MKKNQNTNHYSFSKTENNKSFLRILKRFYTIKETYCFDLFQYLKADHEKLQIIYANIRV